MKKSNVIIGILIVIIVILSTIIVDLRASLQNNFNSIIIEPDKEKVVFVGDSITDGYDVNSYYQYDDKIIVNSGIGGYKTSDILRRFYNLIEQHQADKIFLMIGTNDLGAKINRDEVVDNIKEILAKTREVNPKAKLYYETIYPVNADVKDVGARKNKDIKYVNSKMKEYCEANDITYLDVYSILADDDDKLIKDYTSDGLHLNKDGYDAVTNYLRKYVEE